MQRPQIAKDVRRFRTVGAGNALWIAPAFLVLLWFAGCATTQSPSSFNPRSMNDVRFRDRSQSKFDEEIRATTAVPTSEEAEAIFGANLALKEIQPIWVKVENHGDRTYYLVAAGVDANYYSPIEASYAVHGGLSQSAQNEMENHFRSMTFKNPILRLPMSRRGTVGNRQNAFPFFLISVHDN